jgi:hypothetical protein
MNAKLVAYHTGVGLGTVISNHLARRNRSRTARTIAHSLLLRHDSSGCTDGGGAFRLSVVSQTQSYSNDDEVGNHCLRAQKGPFKIDNTNAESTYT